MIILTNGLPQSADGLIVPNGSITFQLNVDGTVIASPYGFVSADIPIIFQFDSAGAIQPNSPAAAAQIYSNAELQPQNSVGLGTYYLVTFYDANGARINKNPMWWQFPEASGATVDISNITPIATIGGNVIFYPTDFGGSGTVTSVAFVGDGTVLSATPSTPVTTSGNISATLLTQNANRVLAGPTTGAAAAPTFRALVAADIPASAVTPAGATTQIQVNYLGALYADSGFTYDPATQDVSIGGTIGALIGPGALIISPSVSAAFAAPSVVPSTPGASTWLYRVQALRDNVVIAVSAATTITNGAATNTVTDYNTITWVAVSGATSYVLYVEGPGLTEYGNFATISAPTVTYDDIGSNLGDRNGWLAAQSGFVGIPTGLQVGDSLLDIFAANVGGDDLRSSSAALNVGTLSRPNAGSFVVYLDPSTIPSADDFSSFAAIFGHAVYTGVSLLNDSLTGMSIGATTQHTSGHINHVYGVTIGVDNDGAGTVGEQTGLHVSAGSEGLTTGLVDLKTAIHIIGPSTATNSTTINGLLIEDMGIGAATNMAALHIKAQTSTSFAILVDGGETDLNGALKIINSVAATSGANQSSPIQTISGTYWTGSASATDAYTIQDVVSAGSNPTTVLTIGHSGSSGGGSVSVPALVSSATLTAGTTGNFGSDVNLYGNTPATGGANHNFGALKISGNYWDGAASQADTWAFTGLLGAGTNPTSTLTIGHTGTSGAVNLVSAAIFTAPTLIESTSHTPSSASDTGTTGQIAWDASFIYVCIATNTWARAAITGGF